MQKFAIFQPVAAQGSARSQGNLSIDALFKRIYAGGLLIEKLIAWVRQSDHVSLGGGACPRLEGFTELEASQALNTCYEMYRDWSLWLSRKATFGNTSTRLRGMARVASYVEAFLCEMTLISCIITEKPRPSTLAKALHTLNQLNAERVSVPWRVTMWSSSPWTYSLSQVHHAMVCLSEWLVRASRWSSAFRIVLRAIRARAGQLLSSQGDCAEYDVESMRVRVFSGDDLGPDGNPGPHALEAPQWSHVYTTNDEFRLIMSFYDVTIRQTVDIFPTLPTLSRAAICEDVTDIVAWDIRSTYRLGHGLDSLTESRNHDRIMDMDVLGRWTREQCEGMHKWISIVEQVQRQGAGSNQEEEEEEGTGGGNLLPSSSPTAATPSSVPLPTYEGPTDSLAFVGLRMQRLMACWMMSTRGVTGDEHRKAAIDAYRDGCLLECDQVFFRHINPLEEYRPAVQLAMLRSGLNTDISIWSKRLDDTLIALMFDEGPARRGWWDAMFCLWSHFLEPKSGSPSHVFDCNIMEPSQMIAQWDGRIVGSPYPIFVKAVGGYKMLWHGRICEVAHGNPWEALGLWFCIMRWHHPCNANIHDDANMRLRDDRPPIKHVWARVGPWSQWNAILDKV